VAVTRSSSQRCNPLNQPSALDYALPCARSSLRDATRRRTRRAKGLATMLAKSKVCRETRHRRTCDSCDTLTDGTPGHPCTQMNKGPLALTLSAVLVTAAAAAGRVHRVTGSPHRHKVLSRAAVSEPQSWADLALYLSNLPPSKGTHTGDRKYVSLGEASYEQFCRSCHEEDGRGDDDGSGSRSCA
jgi:hypothetical protein